MLHRTRGAQEPRATSCLNAAVSQLQMPHAFALVPKNLEVLRPAIGCHPTLNLGSPRPQGLAGGQLRSAKHQLRPYPWSRATRNSGTSGTAHLRVVSAWRTSFSRWPFARRATNGEEQPIRTLSWPWFAHAATHGGDGTSQPPIVAPGANGIAGASQVSGRRTCCTSAAPQAPSTCSTCPARRPAPLIRSAPHTGRVFSRATSGYPPVVRVASAA